MKLPITKEQTIAALNAWWQSGKSPNVEDCAAFISEHLNKQLAPAHKWQKEREAYERGESVEYRYPNNPTEVDRQWHPFRHGVKSYIWDKPHVEFRLAQPPVEIPAPVVAWDSPEDVPGPVCWLRDTRYPGRVEKLIFKIEERGVSCENHYTTLLWEGVAKCEHSTDRRTWHPCTKPAK